MSLKDYIEIAQNIDRVIDLKTVSDELIKSGNFTKKEKGTIWIAIRNSDGINYPKISPPLRSPEHVICLTITDKGVESGYFDLLDAMKAFTEAGFQCQPDGVRGQKVSKNLLRLNVWRDPASGTPSKKQLETLKNYLDISFFIAAEK